MQFKPLFLLAFGILLFSSLSFAASDSDKAATVLTNTAATLGWAENVFHAEDSDVAGGTTQTISEDGTEDSEFKASITTFGTDVEAGFIMSYYLGEAFGLDESSYQGRSARIMQAGKNCNPKGFVTVAIVGWLNSIFGAEEGEELCVDQNGIIAWTCGKYLFMAADETGEGDPDDIAAVLYNTAEQAGLCGFGDTVVIMAQPNDKAGMLDTSEVAKMGQRVNQFYGVNAFGEKAPFIFTFLDSDGSKGDIDWYTVDSAQNAYSDGQGGGDEEKFAVDATKKAFAGADLPQDVYFERVVVVFAGDSTQNSNTAIFSNQCTWEGDSYFVEVDASQGKRKVYTKSFITLSENRELGGWVHEFGHSLYSRWVRPVNKNTISDRYNYASNDRKYGQVDYWDLMGSGSHWGPNDGEVPMQMSSFTKVAATWLEFYRGNVNQTYSLKALESMRKGDTVLTIDDPTSANAEAFYIIEARDSKAFFGAPESGVVLYKVNYEFSHHVVNIIAPQMVPNKATNTAGQDFTKATLSSAVGPGSIYRDVPGKFQVRLLSQADSPYSASVAVEPFNPVNMVGPIVMPGMPPIAFQGNPDSTENAPPNTMPDQDLHAYDDAGNHVGLNYDTMEYEIEIPGAIASGDLKDDAEWIFVPVGTNVRYEVSEYKTKKFLEQNPKYAQFVQPQNYSVEMVKYDASGNKYVADGGSGAVGTSANVQLKSPTDSSLKYEQKENPGFGENSICPLLPAFLLLIGFAFLGRKN